MRSYRPFYHALFFVAGFGIVFSLLGVSAGFLGRLAPALLPGIRFAGGILLVILGLASMGFTGWIARQLRKHPAWQDHFARKQLVWALETVSLLLYLDRRLPVPTGKKGYSASFLTGIAFSAGWAPCLGPLLAAILLLASAQQTFVQGAGLMAVYTVGLAIPFLITAAGLNRISGILRRINRHARVISLLSGGFLVFSGALLVSGRLLDLSASLIYYLGFGFGLEEILLRSANLSVPLAFLAGTLSFFSPCVLPLVPAYLGYMGGISLADSS